MLLENKVAIVTGGSIGIGKGIANAFAGQGAKLVLVSRTKEELEKTRLEIGKVSDTEVEVFPADVSNPEAVKKLAAFTLKKFSTVDILVNSAGIYGPIGVITDVSPEKWLDAIKINLFGTFLTMQAVLPIMIKNNRGKIVNMSGGGGASPFPRFSGYGTSKAGVIRLTETTAEEVKAYHIDINAIAPGAVNTRLLDEALQAGEAAGKDFLSRSIKQKKEGGVPPEKVGELAVFLASSKSDGLSGRLISLLWDGWRDIPQHLDKIMTSDIYTMRRIVPKDRGYDW